MRPARETTRLASGSPPYHIMPHDGCAFGASIQGYDVREAIHDPSTMARLRADVSKYRLLVFRGQTELTGADHIALSERLGSLDHGLHRPHPRAPDPRLLRVSNDETKGFVSVGTSGWHVDGVMLRAPFAAQTMHFLHAIPDGDTLFLGLNEALSALEPDFQELCRRLWFVSGVGDDLAAGKGQLSILPLVYTHPNTGDDTMCFHLGPKYCLGWIEERAPAQGIGGILEGWGRIMAKDDADGPDSDLQRALRRLLTGSGAENPERFNFLPPVPIQTRLRRAIEGLSGEVRQRAIWKQRWADGDLALIDNMALAHLPTPGTQAPAVGRKSPGLRLFHRTTMVDPAAMLRNRRGASSVLLAGSSQEGKKDAGASVHLTGTTAGAFEAPKAMRYIIAALTAVSPKDARGGDRRKAKAAPARDEAVQALVEGGFSLALLEKVDEELSIAKAGGKDAMAKVLKRLMLELHPDRNQEREMEIVPVFKYLRRLRSEHNPRNVSKQKSVASSVKQRLRQKAMSKPVLS